MDGRGSGGRRRSVGGRDPEDDRRRIGRAMWRGELRRGEIARLARHLDRTPRTLCNWKWRYGPENGPRRPPGRPPHPAEAHARAHRLVEDELKRQGWSAGEPTVWKALRPQEVPRRLVREALRVLKAEHRRRRDAIRRELHTHGTVQARDAVWSVDGTHLGRDEQARKVIAEAVRDVASTRTLGASIGPPPSSAE
ncbi:MAG: hypothetical protein ACYTAF_13635, partial [Planctomycetota bacterium]